MPVVPGSALCRTCLDKTLLDSKRFLDTPQKNSNSFEACYGCFGSGEGPFGDCPECGGTGLQNPFRN